MASWGRSKGREKTSAYEREQQEGEGALGEVEGRWGLERVRGTTSLQGRHAHRASRGQSARKKWTVRRTKVT